MRYFVFVWLNLKFTGCRPAARALNFVLSYGDFLRGVYFVALFARVWSISLLLICASLCPGQDFHGGLSGTVSDASGARVPAAADHGGIVRFSQPASCGQQSEWRVPAQRSAAGDLPRLSQAAGMEPVEAMVPVDVSSGRQITVTLRPSTLRQAVTVQGSASSITTEPINTSSAVVGGVVESRDLQTIPLAQRSFANIAYLVPGTEPVEPSDPTKARITAVSFGGSSGLNDVLSVDGGDNSDDYIGGFLQNFSPDDLQEFAVETAQEDAATGRTVGGAVVITTKRGTNDWHASAAFYERAAALNARYPIENPAPLPKQPFSRQNYVATLGGPIVKDKLWSFSSFEGVNEKASIAYSPASLTQFHALASLASDGLLPGVSSINVPDNVRVPFRDFLVTQRFDWNQTQRSQWFLRGSVDSYTTDNAFVQQATLPSTGTTWHSNYFNARDREPIYLQPDMARQPYAGCQLAASHTGTQCHVGICAGVSVQFHFANHFGV